MVSVLTVEEAAEVAKVGVDCMKALIDTGQLPAVRLNQKHCVVLEDHLMRFLDERAITQSKDRKRKHAQTPAPTASTMANGRYRSGRHRRALPVLAEAVP